MKREEKEAKDTLSGVNLFLLLKKEGKRVSLL